MWRRPLGVVLVLFWSLALRVEGVAGLSETSVLVRDRVRQGRIIHPLDAVGRAFRIGLAIKGHLGSPPGRTSASAAPVPKALGHPAEAEELLVRCLAAEDRPDELAPRARAV